MVFNKTLVMALDWRAKAFARVPFLYAVIVGAASRRARLRPADGGRRRRALISDLPLANLPLQALLLIAVVRFVGTMASYPVGVPAGIFSPMLTLATTVGLIFGLLIEAALVHSPLAVPPLTGAAFAVAAMGGLFSSTIRAPWSASCWWSS